MGTNPSSPPITPPSPIDPNLLISPTNSPQPQSPDDGDGVITQDIIPDPWEDYRTDPNTDNDPDLYPSRPSPPDDNIGYIELLNRAAEYHRVELYKEALEEDFLFVTLSSSQRATQTPPMLKGMLKHADKIFKDPVRARIVTPRIDKKYKPAPTDLIYSKGQVLLDSLVFSNACKRANSQTTGDAPPPDKESKLIDASGKRVAAQAVNHW